MWIAHQKLVVASVMIATLLASSRVHAVADKTNQGRWTTPTENNLPDKEVPGFLVNLGPTGARAVLTEKTFVVRYIFKDSPAVGKLKLDDEITGVFGKPFSSHHFSGGHGYEGPIMDFGEAIEKAEGKDGKLVLNVTRGSETLEVKIDLEPIGTFSATFPINCKKSELLRAKALKYFADHPDSWNVWQAHARSAVTLALLTSDDPKQQSIGKDMALKWSRQSPDAGTWTWGLSYQLITLSEYYLMTKDASVLPMMKTVSGFLEKAQYSGRILVWGPSGDKALEKEDYEKVDAAQQLYDGGFGHGPYKSGTGVNGYGPMQYTTIFAVTAWQLAGRCGVEVNPDRIKRAMDFMHRGTNASGYMAYGGEFTLNAGIIDPVKWKASKGGDNYVGRTGASIIAHKLSPEFSDSADYLLKYRSYCKTAYKSLPDGHADSNLGIFWGLLGASASEDESAFRTTMDYHKAFFNMMRCHDGSFVLLPGRDYADNGYYMASRYHPTATMALVYGLGNPKLLIQGTNVSIPGVNPKALKGKLETAYKALVKKNYGEAALALKTSKSEDPGVVSALTNYLDAQAQTDASALESFEKAGDIYRLDKELAKLRTQYGALDSFKEATRHFEEELRKEPWKMEIKLGANYIQLVEALKRNKSAAYASDLEKFAEKHAESIYGKRAAEVASGYRTGGAVKEPAPIAATPTTSPGAADKTPNSKPVAAPTSATKALAVTPDTLDQWQKRFVKNLDSQAKKGLKLKLLLSSGESYTVSGADEKSLVVQMQGNTLPMPWRQLSTEVRAVLAKDAAVNGDLEALLIAAVFQLATGERSSAEELFAKASAIDAESVKTVKSELGRPKS